MAIRCGPVSGSAPVTTSAASPTNGHTWIKHESEVAWSDWYQGDALVARPNDGRTVRTKYFTDQATGPWFWLAEFGPHQGPRPHSHGSSEVLYLLQGDMRLGNKTHGPGTYVYIEQGTQYQFQAGPHGMVHMNIRSVDAPGMAPTAERTS